MKNNEQDLPTAYRDISERESIAYLLNYTSPSIIAELSSIPNEKLFSIVQTGLIPAAWIFLHLATHENRQIQKAFCLNSESLPMLDICNIGDDSEIQQLSELNPSKNELVECFQSVRAQTTRQLMSLSDKQLKEVYPGQCQVCTEHVASNQAGSPEPHECRADPFRELFTELISQQNYCIGQIHLISCLVSEKKEVWARW